MAGNRFSRTADAVDLGGVNRQLGALELLLKLFRRDPQGGYAMDSSFLQMQELDTDPPAPTANRVRLYARDNGAGKTQLCARFATGAVQVIATEP